MINASEQYIDDSVVFGDNVSIDCEKVKIGKHSKIGSNVKIKCKELDVGDHLFMADGVEIGRGGCNGVNSTVKIGKGVGIFENTVINPSEPVEIGDYCGIGADVMIWTHGAWLDITQGFPADFGPVKIGDNVWLPARSIVLPNVTIGNNVVIGINSIINRSLPTGCFAAGSPCKVIKEDVYPREISNTELGKMVRKILSDWMTLIQYKLEGFDPPTISTSYYSKERKIKLTLDEGETIYDIRERTIEGGDGDIAEDLRDYLRRRGIKFFIDKGFRSI
jgi:acetyltransferase-like isoleucine patch superfamily enzyme